MQRDESRLGPARLQQTLRLEPMQFDLDDVPFQWWRSALVD